MLLIKTLHFVITKTCKDIPHSAHFHMHDACIFEVMFVIVLYLLTLVGPAGFLMKHFTHALTLTPDTIGSDRGPIDIAYVTECL